MPVSGFLGREDSYFTESQFVEENSTPDPNGANSPSGGSQQSEALGYVASFYSTDPSNIFDIPLPKGVTAFTLDGTELVKQPGRRAATQSIFNRYSLFYYNSLTLGPDPEPYMDKPNRLDDLITPIDLGPPTTPSGASGSVSTGTSAEGSAVASNSNSSIGNQVGPAEGLTNVLRNPTASNIIQWCAQGTGDPRVGTNSIEYDWPDFLWCKNYGLVPNNYMVTLRRFPQPVTDDLLDWQKIMVPDVARMVTWVDGESNTWENVGLKFSSKMLWRELESEVQVLSGGGGGGGGGCFINGTLITMSNGSLKTIESIEIGDEILSYNLKTQELEVKPVVNLLKFTRKELIHIKLDNGASIFSTSDHPYFVLDKGWSSFDTRNTEKYQIEDIQKLEIGDILIGDKGEKIAILDIEFFENEREVRTFEVIDNHNYFANGVLVHNKGQGNEGAAIGGSLGNLIKSWSWITQKNPGSPPSAYTSSGGGGGGGGGGGVDPYANKNAVYGSLDVIKKMFMRDKGLEFEQTFTLKFEYELRSIDGVNPKVAMIDLLSNVFVMTANRGEFWGGDIRFFGGGGGGGGGGQPSKAVGPLGDPKKLLAGDYSGYFKSLTDNVKERYAKYSANSDGTAPTSSLEGVINAAKNIGGNLISNIIGGAMDNSDPGGGGGGGGGGQAVNSLLTGEETGEWHVMVGNPANPIISVGNLILENTEYHFNGALGNDDFPSKLTVTCTLKPARHRDRSDMIAMFHRGGRTYTTLSPGDTSPKYSGNKKMKVRKTKYAQSFAQSKQSSAVGQESQAQAVNVLTTRFPNHGSIPELLTKAAEGVY
jgi:hypothetical protein